eukprot:GHVU01037946.1.p1 GENE.GHVU01037946.1~~GHVU01037946.1.p1  ORF type:complete len:102 (+),score=1.66 GHVU01037946.1:200-505(+)
MCDACVAPRNPLLYMPPPRESTYVCGTECSEPSISRAVNAPMMEDEANRSDVRIHHSLVRLYVWACCLPACPLILSSGNGALPSMYVWLSRSAPRAHTHVL